MNIELLQTVFDNLPIAVFVKDSKHRYVYVNDVFVYHAGFPREKCIGFTDKEFQDKSVVDELAQGFEDSDNAVLERGEVNETTFTYNVAGTTPTPFLTRKSRLVTPDGQAFILGTCTDISRVADLEAINVQVVGLNRELSVKMQELRAAQDDMIRRGKMAQLGQLTATVAHELRNPLGSVRTSAFLLERKLAGKELGVEAQLERINSGIVRCDNIISQLLDFARGGKPELTVIEIDAWLVQLLEREAQNLPAQLLINTELGLGALQSAIDGARLSRAIINLLSNASEALFGPIGTRAMNPSFEPRIEVESRLTARGVEVTVADNGPGISADVLPRIREPLFTTKSFGTGLGIPAIEQILDQHRGGLDIWSEPGKGARFTIWWPVQSPLEKAA
jgi:signal transduction histidine kinase